MRDRKSRPAGEIRSLQNVEKTSTALTGCSFPVIAIGASAGGPGAYTALLKALPANSGMALLIIQNPQSDHASALTGILLKTTSIPVSEVTDGMPVAPNHIYVIPLNKSIAIRNGMLRLKPRANTPGQPDPVDSFMLSLSEESAQEELNAANEEVLSGNEQLQSSNQEPATAKEGLQSSNDELTTPNQELQSRNAELKLLTGDLNRVLSGIDIAVLVLDADLRIRRFTPVAGVLLNLIAGDVGRPFKDIASTLDFADWNASLPEVMSSGRLMERQVSDRHGHRYLLRMRPSKTAKGRIDGVLLVLVDIEAMQATLDQVQASRDLALRTQQLANAILNSLEAHVAVLGSDGKIIATNDAWNRFANQNGIVRDTDVCNGIDYLDVCRRAAVAGVTDAQAALDGIGRILDGRVGSFQLEYPCHSDIEYRWFLMNAAPLKGAQGGAVATHTNITTRKLAELASGRSDSVSRALLESTLQAVIAVSPDQRIAFVNGNAETMFGYGQAELVGQKLDLLVPESARGRHAGHYKSYFADMRRRPMGTGLELCGRRKDGSLFPVEIGLNSLAFAGNTLAVAFVTDITQRKDAERALRQTEMEYRHLFEHTQHGIAYCRMIFTAGEATNFQYLTVNSQFERLTGLKDVTGKTANEVIPGFRDVESQIFGIFARVARTREPEKTEVYSVVTRHWYSLSVSSPEQDCFVQIFDVIDERREMERRLRDSEERTRLAVDSTGIGTFDYHLVTAKQVWSDIAKSYLGLPPDAALDDALVESIVHPDDRERVRQTRSEAIRTYINPGVYKDEFRTVSLFDGRLRWVSAWGRVLLDLSGKPDRIVGVVQDITERKRLEAVAETTRREVESLAASLLTAQEDERRRVARELHDQICQQLAALAMDVGALADEPHSPASKERLKAVQARLAKVSDETRHIAYELHPSILDDLGLIAAVRDLCRTFSEQARDVRIDFAEIALLVPVPIGVASCLYRVAQESLHNIVKHAHANRVFLALAVRRQTIALTIRDDGAGFDLESAKHHGGLGLIGMQERVRLAKGKLSIKTSPGHGTRIQVNIPITS